LNILDKIVTEKKKELERYTREYIKDVEKKVSERKFIKDFKEALNKEDINIIAEIKKASPSKGIIRKDFNPVEIAKIYEENGAAAISVLADEKFFQGSIQFVEEVSKVVSIPVMRKDFIIDERQILEAFAKGADSYLLIVRILSPQDLRRLIEYGRENFGMEPLVEIFSQEEGDIAIEAGAKIVGVNNRDLDTFTVDINRSKELCPYLKERGVDIVVAESGISRYHQIKQLRDEGVDAFLVGETLMREEDIGRKLRQLKGEVDE